MQNVYWPAAAKYTDHEIDVLAHSIGGAGSGGHYAFAPGAGAYWRGSVTVIPLRSADACDFRGFLHSLRGQSGSFLLSLPGEAIAFEPATLTTCPRPDGKTKFTDCAEFTDTTGFADDYVFVSPAPRVDGCARFTDYTDFTDGTGFADLYAAPDADNPTGLLGAAATRNASQIAIDLPHEFRNALRVAMFIRIGDPLTGQLLRVTALGPVFTEVRPRLRTDFPAGTLITLGPIYGKFRLAGETPIVPMNGQYSETVKVDFDEFF